MDYLQLLVERYPALLPALPSIKRALSLFETGFKEGGKLLIAGNGGSAADALHIAGELGKSFAKKRPLPQNIRENLVLWEGGGNIANKLEAGLPAIALPGSVSLSTAILNDTDGDVIFAQQVVSLGRTGDVFLGISTSGNAKNVYYAALAAKACALKVIALTGAGGGLLAPVSDAAIIVPESETWKIQELHLPIYHALCLELEERFFQ